MRARMTASSHYFEAVVGDALPSLDAALADACRVPFRRIDRFVQLALVGSARCAHGRVLDPQCGVYFASAIGPVGSNARVQEQMLRARAWPKPFDFINTLGGSAGFYVASNLGLVGPAWFMGDPCSIVAAMDIALTDLAAGAVPQALVGVVEEVPLPLADQRRRLGMPHDTVLAEGSHWWLLESAGDAGRTLELQTCADAHALGAWLATQGASVARVGMGRDVDPVAVRTARDAGAPVVDLSASAGPFHASMEAAWFADATQTRTGSVIALVANGQLLHLGA